MATLFKHSSSLVGMIQLPALPGSPKHSLPMRDILQQVRDESDTLVEAGFDGIMIENYEDVPFFKDKLPPEAISGLSVCCDEVRRRHPNIPMGVNALRNDGLSALSIAHVTNLDFIRVNVLCGAVVTDQGIIEGCAAELLRLKSALNASTEIWADFNVKHAQPLVQMPEEQVLSDLIVRGGADLVLISGSGTGQPTSSDEVERIKNRSSVPVGVGSGITAQNIGNYPADIFIVGTSLKVNGLLDKERCIEIVKSRNELRQS